MGTVELIRGVERRHRWSVEQKLSTLAETEMPGATVSATARCHDLHPKQHYLPPGGTSFGVTVIAHVI